MLRTVTDETSFADRIDPASTALVVVDVQNEFVLPDGASARVGGDVSSAPSMIARLERLIESARSAGVFIVFIQTTYEASVLSAPMSEQWNRRGWKDSFCLEGTKGIEFVEGIGPSGAPNEVVVRKFRFSGFWATSLDLLLRSNGIKTIVLSGLTTEVCVESTARNAFFRDYRIVEAEDCATCFSQSRQVASQNVIARAFGLVVPSAEIMAVWNSAPPGPRNWQPNVKAQTALTTLERRIAAAHTALVLVDFQNDYCSEEGLLRKHGGSIRNIKDALWRARELLDAARAAGILVIHVKSNFGPQVRHVGTPSLRARVLPWEDSIWTISAAPKRDHETIKICQPGSWGAEFAADMTPLACEPVVVKHRFSAFTDSRLELLLRSNAIRTVVFAGVTTNCNIESSVRDAALRDYYAVVARDCVATQDSLTTLHDRSIETMEAYFARVVPSHQIADSWVPLKVAPGNALAAATK